MVKAEQHVGSLVQKVWSFAHVLKDDGLAFMDYAEQITYLLFLKMAWEQRASGAGQIPARYSWAALTAIQEDKKRLDRFHQALRNLSDAPGLMGLIFTKPQSKINDPAKLRLLMQMIDGQQWSSLPFDVKGAVYEGLLSKTADDFRGGAGQYFTPRPVIKAVIEVMQIAPRQTICDPACGTGGFLLSAYEYLLSRATSREDRIFIQNKALSGADLVPNVARLCAMNLFLHGIGTDLKRPLVRIEDSLAAQRAAVDVVLTNPPFGKKSSVTFVGEKGKARADRINYKRPEFWATTSNKQLNFLQHVYSMLNPNGRAAVVVPDNVLYEAGAGEIIRRNLIRRSNLHTILRLPTGIWYSPGVKANVLFFDRVEESSAFGTEAIWYYDLRSDHNFSLRQNPIQEEHLVDFVSSYSPGDFQSRRETRTFRRFPCSEILKRDKCNLDIQWRTADSYASARDEPDLLLRSIISDLKFAIAEFSKIEDI